MSRSLENPGNSRLHKILALVRKYGRIGVKDLSRTFGVSEVTVRGDLAELAKQGLITRTFGGAIDVPAASWRQELAPGQAASGRLESLRAMGGAAAGLLADGDVAYLDSSEEARAMLPFLAGRNRLKVITSSLQVAWELVRCADLEVVLVAGPVAGKTLTIAADFESNPLLARTNISKAFVGAWGLSEAEGFTDINPAEASLKREIISRAKEVVALVKAERWKRVSARTFARITDVDVLITEKEVPQDMLAFCRSGKARVLQAGAEEARAASSPYPYFEGLREYARDHLEYPDRPGRGRSLAFCNGCRSQSFGSILEKSILEQAELAGFERRDVLVLDNDFNAEKAMENAERVLEGRPNVFIQFQADVRINNVIAHRFEKAGIPVIAVEIPIPSVPFVGLNNWKVAMMAGEYATARIRERWGGAEGIDLVLLLQMPVCGDLAMLRTEGFADALTESFGEALQPKILRADCGMGKTEEAEGVMSRILAAHPQARRMVITALDEELMEGAIRALRHLDRWDRDQLILVNYGCTALGREQLQQGLIDATVASFPERYGEYLLPAACALLARHPVPGYTYVQNALITRDNIEQYYP